MSRPVYEITIVSKQRQLSLFYLTLKVKNNKYDKETFNVTNTSIARTAGLLKLTLVRQGGPEIWTVNLYLCGSRGSSFQISL